MFKFKMTAAELENVDAAVKALYSKGDDGNFYLTGITGITAKEKVDEFRNNNISLMEKLKSFEGIDVTKYHNLLLKEKDQDSKKTITIKDLDAKVKEGVEERVGTMRTDFKTEKTSLLEKISVMDRQLESLLIDNSVNNAAIEHNVLKTALSDVISRAKTIFKVEKGIAVGYEGEKKLYDASGTNPLSINSWVKQLSENAPHLFTGSTSANLIDSSGAHIDRNKMTALQKIQSGLNTN
jgi:hypothetical protein